MKIAYKLGLLVAFMSILIALIGAYGMQNGSQANDRLNGILDGNGLVMKAKDEVKEADVAFKTQVQEWKNVLLRGYDAADYDKYLASFTKEHKAVQEHLRTVKPIMAQLLLDTSAVDELAREHDALLPKYLEALKSYDRSKADAAHIVDKIVKGMDRKTTDHMDRLSELIGKEGERRAVATREDAKEKYSSARSISIVAVSVAVLIGIVVSVIIVRGITGPLRSAVDVANLVAKGELTVTIQNKSRDEVGTLLEALREMTQRLSQVVGDVRASADSLSSASEEVSATAQAMNQGASEQAASVEETSASVEEMTGSIAQNGENAKATDAIAAKAAKQAEEGGGS